jgi:hypothetical protein
MDQIVELGVEGNDEEFHKLMMALKECKEFQPSFIIREIMGTCIMLFGLILYLSI